MAIRIIREPSETPNVTSIDDFRIINAAFKGKRGILAGVGNNCKISMKTNNALFIDQGEVIVDGVDIAIDLEGVSLPIDNVAELRYYTVYVEVSIKDLPIAATATIKAVYDTTGYPVVDGGDNLFLNKDGIAKFVIGNVQIQNGAITKEEDISKFLVIRSASDESMLLNNDLPSASYDGKNIPPVTSCTIRYDAGAKTLTLLSVSNELAEALTSRYNSEGVSAIIKPSKRRTGIEDEWLKIRTDFTGYGVGYKNFEFLTILPTMANVGLVVSPFSTEQRLHLNIRTSLETNRGNSVSKGMITANITMIGKSSAYKKDQYGNFIFENVTFNGSLSGIYIDASQKDPEIPEPGKNRKYTPIYSNYINTIESFEAAILFLG